MWWYSNWKLNYSLQCIYNVIIANSHQSSLTLGQYFHFNIHTFFELFDFEYYFLFITAKKLIIYYFNKLSDYFIGHLPFKLIKCVRFHCTIAKKRKSQGAFVSEKQYDHGSMIREAWWDRDRDTIVSTNISSLFNLSIESEFYKMDPNWRQWRICHAPNSQFPHFD